MNFLAHLYLSGADPEIRLGNFIGGELWGRPVVDPNYPLAMVFPHVDNLPRHPSQLYEAFLEGALLFAILLKI
jgi:phosphatidylglycerol:prolipoprotein diacylglycerol transferase